MIAPLHALVAMAENRAIAFRGTLPWSLPLDFRWFKQKTLGATLVMGRKTFASIGQPLPGRTTLVLSRHTVNLGPGAQVFSEVTALAEKLPRHQISWIVGGAEIYRLFLPSCAYLYLTRVKRTTPGDVFFPAFETSFSFDQLIFENADFQVERWRHLDAAPLAPEPWPFATEPTP